MGGRLDQGEAQVSRRKLDAKEVLRKVPLGREHGHTRHVGVLID
jgi:hypothetical protein